MIIAASTSSSSSPRLPPPTNDGVYRILVDGEWRDAASGGVFENVDPRDRHMALARVPECVAAEVDGAVQASRRDLDLWRRLPPSKRSAFSREIAKRLEQYADDLVDLLRLDVGRRATEARQEHAEAVRVTRELARLASQDRSAEKPTTGRPATEELEIRWEPHGVTAVITRSTAPLITPLRELLAALLTGSTAVWKPSPLVPELSLAIAQIFDESLAAIDAPRATFQVIAGDIICGDALVRHVEVDAVFFDGSPLVTAQIGAITGADRKPLRVGPTGRGALYIHDDANLEQAARGVLDSLTHCAGQSPTTLHDIFVAEGAHDAFLELLVDRAASVTEGPESEDELDDEAPPYSPLVGEAARIRLESLLEDALDHGACLAFQSALPAGIYETGWFFPLTIVTDVPEGSALRSHEIAGPVAVVRRVSSFDTALAAIVASQGPAAAIESASASIREDFLDRAPRGWLGSSARARPRTTSLELLEALAAYRAPRAFHRGD